MLVACRERVCDASVLSWSVIHLRGRKHEQEHKHDAHDRATQQKHCSEAPSRHEAKSKSAGDGHIDSKRKCTFAYVTPAGVFNFMLCGPRFSQHLWTIGHEPAHAQYGSSFVLS